MQQLRILLFMPGKTDAIDINHELATRLAHHLETQTTIDLRTSIRGLGSDQLAAYHLIHIMGCWSTAVIELWRKARRLHVPTVYSPLGGLQPWVMRRYRSTYRYGLQKNAIQHSSAVHVCSKLEAETFGKLNWNKRYVLIKNPVLTNQLSFEDMGSAMLSFYHKVLDSNARLLLSPLACQTIGHLLQQGIDKDAHLDKPYCDSMRDKMACLTDTDWRRIFIYATEEHIDDILTRGLERIQFAAPKIDVAAISRFETCQNYAAADLPTDGLCFKSSSLTAKIDEFVKPEETNERALCFALLNFRYELEQHTAPLRHLACIYAFVRTQDMNEDRMKELGKELGIKEFASRLMAVMQDVMRLSEGFMPFALQNDRAAEKMKNDITKFNMWP